MARTSAKPNSEQTLATVDTTRALTPSRVIRQTVIRDNKATGEAIEAALIAAGFGDTKKSTISTVRADCLATLREVGELGMLKSAPRVQRRQEPAAVVETAVAAAG
jgi:hypothetical protein